MIKNKPSDALYSIVKEKINEMIKSGNFTTGEKLPTEADFCKLFDVSRTTVRIALQQLEFEGHVHRVQGKGTFVSKSKIQQTLTSTEKGFAQQMTEQGLIPEIKVIDLQVIPATKSLASALEIEESAPVNKLVRIRLANDEPIQYEISYIPWKIASGLHPDDCSGSLYGLLKNKYNVKLGKTLEAVEPILSDENISLYLGTKIGAPCISIETTAYSSEMTPIEYSFAVFRGDRSRFIIEREYN